MLSAIAPLYPRFSLPVYLGFQMKANCFDTMPERLTRGDHGEENGNHYCRHG
jgi:hypothetical protein